VVSAKSHVENPEEEGYRSLGKMLQGPADLETTDGFMNLVRVG
jgi:ppGpp synthetase/RelA/SpoT-type nucleotidyltranferase